MLEFTVVSNIDSFRQAVDSATILPSLQEAMRGLGGHVVTILRDHTPKGATGELTASTSARLHMIDIPGAGIDAVLEIIQPAISRPPLVARTPPRIYRPFISGTGRTRRHMPPSQALESWVMAKWGVTARKAHRVAFGLARSIARRGTKRNPYTLVVAAKAIPKLMEVANVTAHDMAVQLKDFQQLPSGGVA